MTKSIIYIAGFVWFIAISSCVDVEEEGEFHAYYTLVNKSDYDVRLKYFDRTLYLGNIQYDTVIKRDSSYTMEVIWDIIGPPFHFADTLYVAFDEKVAIEDYYDNMQFDNISFAKDYNYDIVEESYYIRRATYTITNADYEYAKQKLAEREADNGDE
ncbi:MAG: hypothetical protein J6Y37_14575 [Paludibacteraceae bacterium]|nr:hypothetical protein [Paludibacteraceae bacterium]